MAASRQNEESTTTISLRRPFPGSGWTGLRRDDAIPRALLLVPFGSCPWDVNGDGVVNATDLLDLLANWGPCPGGESAQGGGGGPIAEELLWLWCVSGGSDGLLNRTISAEAVGRCLDRAAEDAESAVGDLFDLLRQEEGE